jgi:hypothetical protein
VRPRAVLDEVDRLPGAERECALQHRDLQRDRCQHRLDVRRHVVRSLGVMAPSGVFGRKSIQRRGQIDEHGRIGIFLDGQRRRGVADEQRHRALARGGVAKEFRNLAGEVGKACA